MRYNNKRYQEALDAYDYALKAFEEMGEPGYVAASLHQKAMVYEKTGNFDWAEAAYKKSLAIKVE